MAAARARLEELTVRASTALETYQQAQQAADDARARNWEASERLAFALEESGRRRAALGRWAAQAYRSGGAMQDLDPLVVALTSGSGGDLGHDLLVLNRVGRARATATVAAVGAERQESLTAEDAQRTAELATELTAAAEEARRQSEEAVREQTQQLMALESLLGDAQDAATAAQDELARMAAARAVADARVREDAGRSRLITGTLGECSGGDFAGFSNGGLPTSSLCPLWGAPGHLLRVDAAGAFQLLSEEYARQWGEPLCVTDSYRTLDSQIALSASKPSLAAVPGTSNHGWGRAVDLCGGVQQFGTAQHAWMRDNAARFNWFLPAWAQQGGSKPEPWHWEYAG